MESPYFNTILQFIAQDERYSKEMTAAKEEFERFAGPIYETDRSYDARINSFHNWYILDRPLQGRGIVPLQYFLEYNANSLPEHELRHYQELQDNLHSVFELVRFAKGKTRLRDLLSGRKYDIEGTEHTRLMDRGALFNSRIFRHGTAYYVSNYFLPHPAELSGLIWAEARKVKKGGEDPKAFVFRLVLFQSRYDQYQQMEPKNIYRFGE